MSTDKEKVQQDEDNLCPYCNVVCPDYRISDVCTGECVGLAEDESYEELDFDKD